MMLTTGSLSVSVLAVETSTVYLWLTLLCALLAVIALGGAAAGVARTVRVRRRLRQITLRQEHLIHPVRPRWLLEAGLGLTALVLPGLTAAWVGLCRAAADEAARVGDHAGLTLAAERLMEALGASCAVIILSLPFFAVGLALALAGRSQARGLDEILEQLRAGTPPDAPALRPHLACPGLRGYQTLLVCLAVTELAMTPLLLGGALHAGGLLQLLSVLPSVPPGRIAAVVSGGLAEQRALLEACAAISACGLLAAVVLAVLMLVVLAPERRRARLRTT